MNRSGDHLKKGHISLTYLGAVATRLPSGQQIAANAIYTYVFNSHVLYPYYYALVNPLLQILNISISIS